MSGSAEASSSDGRTFAFSTEGFGSTREGDIVVLEPPAGAAALGQITDVQAQSGAAPSTRGFGLIIGSVAPDG